jgi:hypothetical protein
MLVLRSFKRYSILCEWLIRPVIVMRHSSHAAVRLKKCLGMVIAVGLLFAFSGCIHLPPDVAAEFAPPDLKRPNNFTFPAAHSEKQSQESPD